MTDRRGPFSGESSEAAIFDLALPADISVPFVYNSPHSGRHYPADLMAATRLDALQIRASEDCFVDLLFAAAPRLGAPLMKARYPRAYVDTNRQPYELDPRMFSGDLPDFVTKSSARINAGLGTIPKLVSPDQPIYDKKLPLSEAMARIERVYMPYHLGLLDLLERVGAIFGGVVLIDCHSMPSQGLGLPGVMGRGAAADIVLGDRFGQACAPELSDLAESLFRDLGYSVGRNAPFAGGFNAMHYGRPAKGRHVLQIEINRALYVDEVSLEPTSNFAALAGDLEAWMAAMHAQAAGLGAALGLKAGLPRAAE